MKFYISSGFENTELVRHAAELLTEQGWTHTCDWTKFDVPSKTDSDSLQRIGEREYAGIKSADVVFVFMPRGRGTHIELGMAIALNKTIYLYHPDDSFFSCDEDTCAFYWLPQVCRLSGSLASAIAFVLQKSVL